MNRVNLHPAFVIHTRAYRETSLLVELMTFAHGRVTAIARSARGPRSRYKGVLQLFSPLLVSWSASSDLGFMSTVESSGKPYILEGASLMSGLYLNELLVRLLHRHDPHPDLFVAYQNTIDELQQCRNPEICLRLFEKQLLHELGYGLQLNQDSNTGEALNPNDYYAYQANVGFVAAHHNQQVQFLGEHLLAFHNNQLDSAAVRKTVKKLMRMTLTPLLGNKPIRSRELFL